MNMKRVLVIGLCCITISTSTVFGLSYSLNINSDIKIHLNNEWIKLKDEPFIENDRIMIPLEFVEKLDARIETDLNTGYIKIYKEDIIIEMQTGKNTAKVINNDGGTLTEKEAEINMPPVNVDSVYFVPLRFVAENLGFYVQWDNWQRAAQVKEEGDVMAVERPIEFEIVDRETILNNELLLNLYNENYMSKGIYFLMDDEWMYVLLSAGEKPTGGYSLSIDSITEVTPGTAYINAILNSPDKDSIVTQALTFPNKMLKFDKNNIVNIQWDLSGNELSDEAERNEVINLVQNFGGQLKMVSLLAPEDIIKENMEKYYCEYVTSKLIEDWLDNPAKAPGRLLSSPWPERIDILEIEKLSEDEYEVKGNIIELTSAELKEGGIAVGKPITLNIKKYDEKWVIDAFDFE
ncbi:protease complex subunit PrcB family protein [Sedimentibacter hydroxybenzoicus DSM 7310]|uniref:Protease complex subunit PrcB family protein n=1 Tax=Sedimentibacter hydroxybenzoicus DSM 7310 TaxID=1123245 RepID=A0A974GV35_SEDHY|nr:stalk domain-containing protein [Sedimentibacter hydroxybenzoicus]NYB72952.1 protease complex subunit PrcB family protein [Sedimentibacter hydroxybenzoicus DSM 7310]